MLEDILSQFDVRDKAKNVILTQAERNNGRLQPSALEAMLEDLPSGLDNQRLIGMVGDEYQEGLQLLDGQRKDYRRGMGRRGMGRKAGAGARRPTGGNGVLQTLQQQNRVLLEKALEDNSSGSDELRKEFEEKLEEEKEKRHQAELEAERKEKEHLKDRMDRLEQKFEGASSEGLSPRERTALVKLFDSKSDQLLGIKALEAGVDPRVILQPQERPEREKDQGFVGPEELAERIDDEYVED